MQHIINDMYNNNDYLGENMFIEFVFARFLINLPETINNIIVKIINR